MGEHMKEPAILSPTTVLSISINTGSDAFYGTKYNVAKVPSISCR